MPEKLGVVLDTNVVFSALIKDDGVCSEAVTTILSNKDLFALYFTPAIKDEYYDVLYRPKLTTRISRTTIDLALTALFQFGEEIMARPLSWLVYPDDSDKPFVEAAIYADATLVTSNMKDYPFIGLKVAYPQEFLDSLNNTERPESNGEA